MKNNQNQSSGHGGKRPGAGRREGAQNKATKDIKALAQPYGPEAVETLVSIMRNGETHAVRKSAADSVLDRAYGKSSQPVEHSGHLDIAATLDRVFAAMDRREQALVPDAVRH